jgi:uncharacterized membrane protein YfcA
MIDKTLIVLVPLSLLGVWLIVFGAQALARQSLGEDGSENPRLPSRAQVLIGLVTDFFDTLGIGSFATTTSLFRIFKVVPDRLVPGTLNAGHALPTVVQALIYISIVEVDLVTLLALIASSVLGALLGAGSVARWSERRVQLAMGSALFAAAALMLARLLDVLPPGGDHKGLTGAPLVLGIAGNFALGALMTMGIGLYAPCMILVSLLGMSPKVAFPIMMGSCAFLMPLATVRFVRQGSYAPRAALGLTLGGVPAVLLAAYIVKQLPLDAVRWLVLAVVLYTAASLLRASRLRG